ncbi:hypothetical protein NC652_022418 [Populus alba x Populus x berolinensis]|nr:hypothetical protein NC652_022418 [Populus alba x Populus x berolinensis]
MAHVASQELILELRIYFHSFDRAGYGESDPNPNRPGASSWVSNCPILVAFLSLSSNQGGLQETASRDDKWKLRIAHYVPGQLNWWMSHKWFPSSSYVEIVPETVIRQNKEFFESLHRDLMLNTSTMFAGSCSGIRYHEVNDGGHLIEYDTNICSKCQPEWNTCFPPVYELACWSCSKPQTNNVAGREMIGGST